MSSKLLRLALPALLLALVSAPACGGSDSAAERDAATVERTVDGVDRYGRLLRYVHSAATNVNVELVRRGAATAFFFRGERGCYAGRLLVASEEARAERHGLWGACRVSWSPDRQVQTRHR